MATYNFDTITAEQALSILPNDTVVTGDYSPNPRVAFLPATATDPERVQVTLGDGPFERTVVFSTNIVQLSSEGRFSVSYIDKLLIGGAGGETMSGAYVFGGGGADSLSGSRLTGGDGNDTLSASTPNGAAGSMDGGAGDDVLIATGRISYGSGGEGYDTVVLSGARDDYVLYGTDGGVSIFGPDNSQFSFSSVEKLVFSDGERALVNTLSLTGPDPANRAAEGNSGEVAHRFVATRTGDLSASITVDWHTRSVNNADIVNRDGQITFQAGQSQVEFFVRTPGDTEPEFFESFDVVLENGPTWLFDGRAAGSGVNNDDGDNFVVLNVYRTGPMAEYGAPEGQSGSTAFNFTVSRTGDTTIASTADYRVVAADKNGASANDFAGGAFPTGSISFDAGETTKTITINVQGDRVIEGTEYFKLQLVNVSANTSVNYGDNYNGATGIILNDDVGPNPDDGPGGAPNTLSIARNEAPLSEGHSGVTPYTFTVNRVGNTSQTATVDYSVTGSGANPADAADFQGGVLPSGTVTFAAGETSRTITINVRGDATVETDEEFTVTLSNATGTGAVISTVEAKAVILNDEFDRPPESGGGGSAPPPTSSAPEEPRLIGGPGPDTIQGTTGADTIGGGNGVSYLRGAEGNDIIIGGVDFDDINGNQGDDTASGGFGADWVVGGKDNDFLTGDGDDDIVYGNLGDDTCEGGDGRDLVRGGQGNDVVRGGAENDWLSGDRGDDTITGGTGADIFHSFGEAGIDRVLDFSRAEGDRVQLDPGTVYTVSQVGADTVIDMQGGGQVILVGVAQSSLSGDWIFVA